MRKSKKQKAKSKNLLRILICAIALAGSSSYAFAETTYLVQRENAIDFSIGKFLEPQLEASKLETKLEYMQGYAYYLYSRGMYEDAISIWKKILLLDSKNKAVLSYIKKSKSKIRAKNKTKEEIAEEKRGIASMRQKKLGPTQSQYSHTKPSYNEMAPHLVMGENRFFDHSISLIRNDQEYANKTDRETTSIAENIRAFNYFENYNSTFSASWLYDHTTRDDFRFPRYINFLMEGENSRFAMGDNSSYLSRYVLNGMNYRGLDFMLNTDESKHPIDRFKILYGVAKSFDTQSDDYFYPIEVFGLRNEIELNPKYKFGTSFAYQVHEDKITRVDSLFRPRKNIVGSFDQYIKLADWWIIRHELAYSRLEDEVKRVTIQEELATTEDWAHYLSSNITKEKWQLINSYEYGGPNFQSLTGEVRFLHNWVLSDKEIFENVFIFTPTDLLMFELQYHRMRNNLHGEADKESTKENQLKSVVRITPNNWLPTIGLTGSILRTRSIAGSSDISNKRYARDLGIELQKTLYETDWGLGYTYQKSAEDLNYKFCDLYRNIYSIKATRALIPDRTYLNTLYSFADLDILLPSGDMDDSAYENKTDISVSSRLWNASNVSVGYNYFNRRDYVGALEDLDSHTGSFVFSWPYTKEFFNKRKLTLMPYLSWYLTKNDEYSDNYRAYFASRLDTSYYFNPENKLDLMLEYKEGSDDSTQNLEGNEVRFMATYTSAIGL